MNDIRSTLPCPLCSTAHIVPVSRNRSKCKTCKTWLQINDAGDALQDYFAAKNKTYLLKRGVSRIYQIRPDTSKIKW